MKHVWLVPASVSGAFLAFSLYVVATGGPLGFVAEVSHSAWGAQLGIDLVLMASVALGFGGVIARRLGVRTWPWVIATLLTGSIGALAFAARLLYARDHAPGAGRDLARDGALPRGSSRYDRGVKLKQTLRPHGPATAIVLSDAQVETLGGGKRAAVVVTIGGKSAPLRLMVMGGQNLIGISKANRAALGVEIGDTVDATIELDRGERVVEVPADAAKALAKAKLRAAFDALAFTHRKEHVQAITGAKKPETRARRIEAMLAMLRR